MDRDRITKEDIFIKARMLSEGVDLTISKDISPELYKKWTLKNKGNFDDFNLPEKLDFDDPFSILSLLRDINKSDTSSDFRQEIIFDNSSLRVEIIPNKRSRLELRIEGEKASVIEKGKTLITGRFLKNPKWLNQNLGGGINATVSNLLPSMSSAVINVVFSLSCFNFNTGQGCRYCNLFSNPISRKIYMLPMETLELWAMGQGRAVKIAIDNGWSGSIAISGGALAPAQRGEYLQRLKVLLSTLKKAIGEKVYNEIPKVYNHYPPEDFADMYKWKEMGITSTSFDLEVMDDAYFPAICPGKASYKPLSYLRKAQEYSVDVFGPLFGTIGCIVMGIEPMSTLIAGFEERISKGVLPMPLVFISRPGAAYEGFRPPTAEWIVKASEKMAGSFMKHMIKWLPKAIKYEKEKGLEDYELTSGFNSLAHRTILFDEIILRINKIIGDGPISDLLEVKNKI